MIGARKKTIYILFFLLLLTLGFLFFKSNKTFEISNGLELLSPLATKPTPTFPYVKIGYATIPVEIATTTTDITKGLSGRPSLEAKSGLLFIFQKLEIYQFWMPDMFFPIDIIWISNDFIIDISKNVSNDFDPKNPIFYKPSKPINYVLEVNAGFSERYGIKVGDKVLFNNIKK